MSTTATIGDTASQDTAITDAVFCDYNAINGTPLDSVSDVTQDHIDSYTKQLVARAVNKHEKATHQASLTFTDFS